MFLEGKENGNSIEVLRIEIKTYEKNFLDTNGRKPERADIKRDAAIGLFNLRACCRVQVLILDE